MAHLKKSGSSGHLLHSSGGHLVNKCSTTTTTSAPTSTTTEGTTTTTGFNNCETSCPSTIYADITIECGNSCAGTYQWDWDNTCEWTFTSGDCASDKVYWNTARSPSEWPVVLFGPASGTNGACSYSKSGDMEDCPTGTYSLDTGDCGDCTSEIDIYS